MSKDKQINYMVWDLEEVTKVCTKSDLEFLDKIIDRVLQKREEEGKPRDNNYFVMETSDPAMKHVKEAIRKYEEG